MANGAAQTWSECWYDIREKRRENQLNKAARGSVSGLGLGRGQAPDAPQYKTPRGRRGGVQEQAKRLAVQARKLAEREEWVRRQAAESRATTEHTVSAPTGEPKICSEHRELP